MNDSTLPLPSKNGNALHYKQAIKTISKGSSPIFALNKFNYQILSGLYEHCLFFRRISPSEIGELSINSLHDTLRHLYPKYFRSSLKPEIDATEREEEYSEDLSTEELINFFEVIIKNDDSFFNPQLAKDFKRLDFTANYIVGQVIDNFTLKFQGKIENINCDSFSLEFISLMNLAKDFPFLDFRHLLYEIGRNLLVFLESIFQFEILHFPHDYSIKSQFTYEIYNSPLKEIIYCEYSEELKLYIEIMNDDGSIEKSRLKYKTKNEGVGTGFQIHFNDHVIYVKQLFYGSNTFKQIKSQLIDNYLDSITAETNNNENISATSHRSPYSSSFHARKKYSRVDEAKQKHFIFSDQLSPILLHQHTFCEARYILDQYINPYAEMISYVILYYMGFMPPLNIIKSQFFDEVYVMVDHFSSIDKDLSSEYVQANLFPITQIDMKTANLNSLCSCLHLFHLFNYLFHLGDFHDGNYAICQSREADMNGTRKYRIIAFDLWMSPFQIQCNGLLDFDHESCEDDNASFVYSKLYHDQNVIADFQGSNLRRIMNGVVGKDRLPYITLISLKRMFMNLVNNLPIIYESNNYWEQMCQEYLVHSPNKPNFQRLTSSFLLEKLYNTSKDTILENKDLIEYYEKYNEPDIMTHKSQYRKGAINSHKYLVNNCQVKLLRLYESLLDSNSIPMVFVRKPKNFHVKGSQQLLEDFESFKSADLMDASHPFVQHILKPIRIKWIFIFVAFDGIAESFFEENRFSSIENDLNRQFKFKDNIENAIFIIYRNIVACDLYRTYLRRECQFSFYKEKIVENHLLFVHRNVQAKDV